MLSLFLQSLSVDLACLTYHQFQSSHNLESMLVQTDELLHVDLELEYQASLKLAPYLQVQFLLRLTLRLQSLIRSLVS